MQDLVSAGRQAVGGGGSGLLEIVAFELLAPRLSAAELSRLELFCKNLARKVRRGGTYTQ